MIAFIASSFAEIAGAGTDSQGDSQGPTAAENGTRHWAYISPQRPELPNVENESWPRNAIDYFILNRLEEESLSPSPPADSAKLIRRVSLDLIGLPPSINEVQTFVNDGAPGVYQRLVNRLLASPRYGERWARPWLDMARYADSQGYEKDRLREIWHYRDWVIEAFNKKMPFDQFTIEQIAGDMLPNATRNQKIATGFHRNTMTNTEGGTSDEEYRVAAVVDRVNTTMEVWMSSTFGCAQCHDHKYDPFTQKEYYRMFAFFNNTADADRANEHPVLRLATDEQEEQLAQLDRQIKAAQKRRDEAVPEGFTEAKHEWIRNTRSGLLSWNTLTPKELRSAGGASLTRQKDESVLAGGPNPKHDTYTFAATTDISPITGLRLEVLSDNSLPHDAVGRGTNGNFHLTGIRATASPIAQGDKEGKSHRLKFASVKASYPEEGGSVTNLFNGDPKDGWRVGSESEIIRDTVAAYFTTKAPLKRSGKTKLAVTLTHRSKTAQANIGRFRVAVTGADEPQPSPEVPKAIREILVKAPSQRSEEENVKLDRHFRSFTPLLKEQRNKLADLRRQRRDVAQAVVTTPVMQELEEGRQTHLLKRGSFLNKGEKVSPGVPQVLHSLPEEAPRNRLALAKWLVDEDNPLTARVIVNRLWEKLFGIGIVKTSQDFGTQGRPPSHPKLLDWLATELMRRDWRIEEMLKLMVNSAAYRQSADVTPELRAKDPYNRLLARGPRFRLEAEAIRDQALKVSGLLAHRIGGPSVMPPQPDGIWGEVVYSGAKWETSEGADRYRRGIYTFWRRTSPYPSVVTFDAPSREFCVMKRTRSNTPLQALTLLNDPVYVECAQALARRMLTESGPDLLDHIRFGFRLCLARKPAMRECERLMRLYEKELNHYKNHPQEAEKMATNPLGSTGTDLGMPELAAMTVVANVLLNLDEVITKG